MLGLGLGLNKAGNSGGLTPIPYREDALHYSTSVIDTTRNDVTGSTDRTSIMSKMFVGDGSLYIDTGIVPNQNTVTKVKFKLNSTPGTTKLLFGCRTVSDTNEYMRVLVEGNGVSG